MKRVLLIIWGILCLSSLTFSQTQGTLTVTVTTSTAGGNYSPRNIVAIWIANSSGGFVKTLTAYTQNNNYKRYLSNWSSQTSAAGSQYNIVDAVTGATRNPYGTYTTTWNATDFNKTLVADGTYNVRMELTDKNATGNYSSFTFTKGPNAQTVKPNNVNSFSNITITWTPVVSNFNLTVTPPSNGTISPSSGSYASGASVALTATPASGYVFSGWTGDASGTTNPYTLTMNSNKTVGATFTEVPKYNLTITSPSNGTISPSSGSYASGATVTLTATPASGYVFSGWTGDPSGTTNPVTIIMNSNKTVGATFTAIPKYTITTTTAGTGMGIISPSIAGSYTQGTTLSTKAIEYIGSSFTEWTGDTYSTSKNLNITVNANANYVANFATNQTYNIFEIEDGTYTTENAVLASTNAGYSGTGYLNMVNASGTYSELTVYAPSAGQYDCSLFYAYTSDAPTNISVNGTQAVSLACPSSGSATNWVSTPFELTLAQGANTIRFTSATATGAPYLDKIHIQLQTTKTQTVSLSAGWNMVSFSVTAPDMTIATLLTGKPITMVKTLSNYWSSTLSSFLNSLSQFEAGKGYLIYATTATTLALKGIPYNGAIQFANKGWELIGVPYTPVSISNLGFNFTVIKNFTGMYEFGGTMNSLNTLEPGKAYFIK
ncbi:MAG: DUF2271 domain-containing protein [Bacteroidales bacterium]|nr:DUF2271 domain-containing protein [Bacteroidales bacterium]